MNKKLMQERVRRGARFLDEKAPGWANQIKLSKLDMRDACLCIAGQLCAVRNVRYHGIEVDDSFPAELGMDTDALSCPGWGDDKEGYEYLNHLWDRQIRQRRPDFSPS